MSSDEQLRSDAERNRRLVLETAIELLGRDPQASVQEIVNASGLGRTTFYRHFGDRDELLEAVLAEIVEQARQTTAAAAIDPADPGPSIRRMTSAYLEVAFAYGPLIDSLDGASATLDSALESDRSPTKQFLDAARDLGTIRTDMPRRWQQSVMRSVPLTGIQQVAAGYLTRPEAERLVAGTLTSVLLPSRG